MEPGLGGREDLPASQPGADRPLRRNGARPRGPGRLDVIVAAGTSSGKPQWSPASGAGKTG